MFDSGLGLSHGVAVVTQNNPCPMLGGRLITVLSTDSVLLFTSRVYNIDLLYGAVDLPLPTNSTYCCLVIYYFRCCDAKSGTICRQITIHENCAVSHFLAMKIADIEGLQQQESR
jgi:hypothetical protein